MAGQKLRESDYRRRVAKVIRDLEPVFLKTAIGDFDAEVKIPTVEDEFTELYVGIQLILDVVNEKLGELENINANLEQLVREKTKALVEAQSLAHLGSWEWDLKTNESYWSDELFRILGMVKRNTKPSTELYLSRVHPEDLPKVRTAFAEAAAGQSFTLQHRFMIRKTAIKYVSARCEIRKKSGQVTAAVGTVLDITELKKAELALIQKTRELERSNAELEQFAHIASHDLKEPLRAIHHYSTFLLQDYENVVDETGKGRLQALIRLSKRMELLTNALLQYARLGLSDLALRKVNLDEVLDHVLETLRLRLEESGAVVRRPKALPVVKIDAAKVSEVFQNLISNAIKYNDKEQKLVEVGVITASGNDGPRYTFYVRDNGIGIPKKHYETIFRIFKRLHAKEEWGGGAGAGMTIAKKIIESHGGRIWIESEEGVGSTFYFTLAKENPG